MSTLNFTATVPPDEMKQHFESLNQSITAAQDALDRMLRVAETVKDDAAQGLARNASSSFAATGRLAEAAREECVRLSSLVPELEKQLAAEANSAEARRRLSKEAGAKLSGILNECAGRLFHENFQAIIQLLSHFHDDVKSAASLMKELDKESGITGVSIDSLDGLSGIEFEGLVRRLVEHMGFRAEMTKASGDGGIDVIATLDQPLIGGRYLIQCKRYAPDSTVGAATVREFYGALTADRRAIKGILITTSAFTAQAREFAQGLSIELIARDQLQGLLERHGLMHKTKSEAHPLARLSSAYSSMTEAILSIFPPSEASSKLRLSFDETVGLIIFNFREIERLERLDPAKARELRDKIQAKWQATSHSPPASEGKVTEKPLAPKTKAHIRNAFYLLFQWARRWKR